MTVRALGTAFASRLHREVLKPAGFRKAGATFSRVREGCVEMFNIQGSPWNAGAQPWEFYVNVRVLLTDLVDAVDAPWNRKYHADGRLHALVPEATASFHLTTADLDRLVAEIGAHCMLASARLPTLLDGVRGRALRGLHSTLPVPDSWKD